MISSQLMLTLLFALVAACSAQVIDIGSHRELFADRYLIEELKGTWRKLRADPVFPPTTPPAFDSQNLAFWSEREQRYVAYYSTFKVFPGLGKVRWITRATSDDFLRWSVPQEMSFGDAPPEHLYINQTSPYFRAPHIYVSIAARFWPGKRALTDDEIARSGIMEGYYNDISDVVLMTSRGGTSYDRTFLENFVGPGSAPNNWASCTNYPVLNTVQTGPEEMSFYVNRDYAQPTSHVNRYTLRLDGFSSVHAPYTGGEILTRTFTFSGKELEINYSTSAAGGIRVEMQDASGRALPGFAAADSQEIIGDHISRVVSWKFGSRVVALAGKPVRLRFVMKDADLYSIRFRN
jgi:hypothetical protein